MLDQIRKKQKIVIYVIAAVFVLGMAPLGLRELFKSDPISGKINGNDIDLQDYNNTLQNSFYGVQMILSNISSGESQLAMIQEDKRDINTELRKLKYELKSVGTDSLKMEELNDEIAEFESSLTNKDDQKTQIEDQIKSLKESLKTNNIDYNQYKQNNSISDNERLKLEDKNWADYIGKQIIEEQISHNHIKVSKKEYNKYIFDSYSFLYDENGAFNQDMFSYYLKNSEMTPDQFKESVYYQIRIEKLRDKVTADSLMSAEEFDEDYVKRNTKRSAKVLAFPSYKFQVDSLAVTEKDIENYYNENKEKEYKLEAAVKVKLATFEVKVSDEDKQVAIDELTDILDQVKAKPSEFSNLAKEFSQDPGSGSRGGDLGWFGHGRMVAQFDSVAFALKKGEVSEPFETSFGFHILTVDDKKVEDGEEQVKARHILIKYEISNETKSNVKDASQSFVAHANHNNFDTLAEELNGVVTESPMVAIDGSDFQGNGKEAYNKVAFMANSYFNYGFLTFLENSHVNSVSNIFRSSDGNYTVAMITEKATDSYKELNDDLKKSIRNKLETEKKREIANSFLDNFYNNYAKTDYAALITDSLLAKSTLDTVRVKINFTEIENSSLPKEEKDTYMLRADYKAAKKGTTNGLYLVKVSGTNYLVTLNKEDKKIVANIKMAVNEAKNISKVSKYLSPISNSEAAVELLFSSKLQTLTDILTTDEGNFMIKVISHENPDMEKYSETRNSEFEKKIEQDKNSEFNKWYGQKLKEAKVIDRRFMVIK